MRFDSYLLRYETCREGFDVFYLGLSSHCLTEVQKWAKFDQTIIDVAINQ